VCSSTSLHVTATTGTICDGATTTARATSGRHCSGPPFDASLVDAGAYDELWAHVHLGPENALKTHRDLRARLLLPVHWGTFNQGLHAWTEPIERLRQLSAGSDLVLAQPFPGESFEIDGPLPQSRWWQPAQPAN
jgi:L-ascorbate metabolism protein UlaG (beta-lactamase superfamily)